MSKVRQFLLCVVTSFSFPVFGASSVFSDCQGCPSLVIVPAQSIALGTDAPRKGEIKTYFYTLAHPFAMMQTEVTFDLWEHCVQAGHCPRIENDRGWGRGQRPVIDVTWQDAQVYGAWLSALTGQVYRLPTENEWEVAARAGAVTRYSWGDTMEAGYSQCRFCNHLGPIKGKKKTAWTHKTVPVASYRPNAYGLYDMVGNVWEWTATCWSSVSAQPSSVEPCKSRVVRGGSWYFYGVVGGSPARTKEYHHLRSYDVGFRLVRELP